MDEPKTICVECKHFIDLDSMCGASPRKQKTNPVTGKLEPLYPFLFAREVNFGDCQLYEKGTPQEVPPE